MGKKGGEREEASQNPQITTFKVVGHELYSNNPTPTGKLISWIGISTQADRFAREVPHLQWGDDDFASGHLCQIDCI